MLTQVEKTTRNPDQMFGFIRDIRREVDEIITETGFSGQVRYDSVGKGRVNIHIAPKRCTVTIIQITPESNITHFFERVYAIMEPHTDA